MTNSIRTRSTEKRKESVTPIDSNESNTTVESDELKNKKKKSVKHSKKFVRTQTGCLQCRQKKKKCDGKRPNCLSCEKRGISCEFPENIRFFQFNQANTANASVSKPKKNNTNNNNNSTSKSTKSTQSINSSSLSGNVINFSFQDESKSTALNSRSSSMSSLPPSLVSDLSDVSDSEIIQPSHIDLSIETKPKPRQKEKSTHIEYNDLHLLPVDAFDLDTAEQALTLANDGKSINNILNNITIDLIKQSINNLQYINLESKLKPQEEPLATRAEINKTIKDGLQFVDEHNHFNGFSFKPDEFFSFEN